MNRQLESTSDALLLDPRVYARGAGVLWRSTPRATLAVIGSGEAVAIAGVASRAWQLLSRPQTLGELAEELAGEFVVPAARVAADLAPVIDDLVARGILAVVAR